MDIDYDLLAKKVAEEIGKSIEEPKKLTGRAYWIQLRKEKNKLKENYISPVSGAPSVPSEYFGNIEAKRTAYKALYERLLFINSELPQEAGVSFQDGTWYLVMELRRMVPEILKIMGS